MLTEEEQAEVRSLLEEYSSVFATHDGDLGCTNLISHDIPLLDDVPVRQRYRRIPPSEYEAVKAHINQLLEAQVIKESRSPYASSIVLVRKLIVLRVGRLGHLSIGISFESVPQRQEMVIGTLALLWYFVMAAVL